MKKQIKDDIDNENDEKLNKLVSAIINSNVEVVVRLKSILLNLRDKNINTDVEELKRILLN